MKLNSKNSLIIFAIAIMSSTSAFAGFTRHYTALDAKCTDASKDYKVRVKITNAWNQVERSETYKLKLSNSKEGLNQSRTGGFDIPYEKNKDNKLKLRLHTPNRLNQDDPTRFYETKGDGIVIFEDKGGSTKSVNVACTIKWDDGFAYSSLRESDDYYEFGYSEML